MLLRPNGVSPLRVNGEGPNKRYNVTRTAPPPLHMCADDGYICFQVRVTARVRVRVRVTVRVRVRVWIRDRLAPEADVDRAQPSLEGGRVRDHSEEHRLELG